MDTGLQLLLNVIHTFLLFVKLFLHMERIINNGQIFHDISTISKSAEEKKI